MSVGPKRLYNVEIGQDNEGLISCWIYWIQRVH